eukprot:494185_1
MGNTQTYPNAKEEVETTIFYVDFVFWTIAAVVKTTLLTIWVFHAYCNVNIIPTHCYTQKQEDELSTHQKHHNPTVKDLSVGNKSPSVTDANRTRSVSAQDDTEKRRRGTSTLDTDGACSGTDVSVGTLQTSHSHPDRSEHTQALKNTPTPSNRPDTKARFYITLSITAATLYAYFYTTLHTLRYLGIVGEFSCALTAISLGLGWALNRLFLYLYLMHRLKVSFQGTFLQMNQSHFNMLMRMYFILFTVGVLFYFMWGSYVSCDGMGILISFLPLNGFDSLCAIICLYIFIKKLNCLVNMDRIAYNKDPKGMTSLKYLVNKFLIISVFAISFTYVVSLLFFIYPMKCLGGVDTMVNVFCLMITTGHYDFYYRMSCYLCRRWCEKSFKFGNQLKNPPIVILH